MKTMKNKTFLLVIALVLVLSLSIGLTFAYFSDYTEAKGGASLTLGGSIEIKEPDVSETGKKIEIYNTGDTEVLVRVRVIGPKGTTVTETPDWKPIGDYYYYTQPLPVGDTPTSKLEASFSGDDVAVSLFDVLVVADCAQVTYNTDNTVAKPEGTPAWPDPKDFLR